MLPIRYLVALIICYASAVSAGGYNLPSTTKTYPAVTKSPETELSTMVETSDGSSKPADNVPTVTEASNQLILTPIAEETMTETPCPETALETEFPTPTPLVEELETSNEYVTPEPATEISGSQPMVPVEISMSASAMQEQETDVSKSTATEKAAEIPCPEPTPIGTESLTEAPKEINPIQTQKSVVTTTSATETPCPELPTPEPETNASGTIQTQESVVNSPSATETPCPELPTPEPETSANGAPVTEKQQGGSGESVPTVAINTPYPVTTLILETPAPINVEAQESTPYFPSATAVDVPLMFAPEPDQTLVSDNEVPGSREAYTPTPVPTTPCPVFTLVPDTQAPETDETTSYTPASTPNAQHIVESETYTPELITPVPDQTTPCPVFTLVPDTTPLETETASPVMITSVPETVAPEETTSYLPHPTQQAVNESSPAITLVPETVTETPEVSTPNTPEAENLQSQESSTPYVPITEAPLPLFTESPTETPYATPVSVVQTPYPTAAAPVVELQTETESSLATTNDVGTVIAASEATDVTMDDIGDTFSKSLPTQSRNLRLN